MGFINDLFIGTLAGIISAAIVNIYCHCKEHKRSFENDKQLYCRYIQIIRVELFLAFKNNDYDGVILAIENEPIRNTFGYLSDNSIKAIHETQNYISNLKNMLMEENIHISEGKYKEIRSKLYQYTVAALKLTEQKPHEYVKNVIRRNHRRST